MSYTRSGLTVCDQPIYENGQHIGFCARALPGRPNSTPSDGWVTRADGDFCSLHSGVPREPRPVVAL
jgi:hypothetical protein